jgi:phosphoadenosine phosphosulfate reductase
MTTEELNRKFSKSAPEEVLKYFLENFKGRIVFASSMGAEDQVLTDMIVRIDPEVKIFTLGTGRLFKETTELIEITNKKYDIHIEVRSPDKAEVEQMVKEKGLDLFYKSVDNRKLCCSIRKKHPLKKALTGMDVWICGLRREQSITRYSTPLVENDLENGLLKINPLFEWTEEMVWDYIRKNNVPYNILHEQGFPSIGCQPCTRAIKSGEDIRSGRWWWEESENKECGLHEK